jgi:hypothetical protein
VSGDLIEIVVPLTPLTDVFLHVSIGSMETDVSQYSLVTVETSMHGLN